MPSIYIPKNNPFSGTRIAKIAKDLIKDAKDDRELTLEAYHYFKARVEGTDQPDTADRAHMVALLKILQTTHSKTSDAIAAVLKYEDIQLKHEKSSDASKESNEYEFLKD